MKLKNLSKFRIAIAMSTLLAFTAGCGSGTGAGGAPAAPPAPPGGVAGGCASVYQPIGFNASNIYFNGNILMAGTFPPQVLSSDGNYQTLMQTAYPGTVPVNGIFGTLVMTGNTAVTPLPNQTITPGAAGTPSFYTTLPNRPEGSLAMNITPMATVGAPGVPISPTAYTTANATGTVSINLQNPSVLSRLASFGFNTSAYTGYPGYTAGVPQPAGQTLCISGIAISINALTQTGSGSGTPNTLFQGRISFLVNGQQRGFQIMF